MEMKFNPERIMALADDKDKDKIHIEAWEGNDIISIVIPRSKFNSMIEPFAKKISGFEKMVNDL